MLNAYFQTIPADKITFTNNNVAFNDFQILDSGGNKATINGTVGTQDPEQRTPSLTCTWMPGTRRALNSTAKDNKVFYGNLLFTSNLNVKGTPSAPDVDGSIAILKGTDTNSVVMPESDPGIVSSAGIIKFIDVQKTRQV